MKKEYIIRYTRSDFETLKRHFQSAVGDESQAFALFSHAICRRCNLFVCNTHVLPDKNELRNQSAVSIEPSRQLQALAYGLAYETGKSAGDEHNHPFTDKPRFSSVDDYHGHKNALYLSEHLPEPATMIMVVFGHELNHFQARVWNRKKSRWEPVNRLEILGSPIQILDREEEAKVSEEDPYARHRIIPGWQQGQLEELKVFLCGLGGNGSEMWQGLLALGVGRNGGWLKACDPDVVEASNLPRIPYACPTDVGKPKATVAQSYARRKAPEVKASCYQESIDSSKMRRVAKEANVIVGAVDGDGPRKVLNGLAVRYLTPLVDVASEITPNRGSYEAAGQVRVVIPGKTGCLICSGMIDPSEAALDLASEQTKQERAKVGYVRGTDQTPVPSVLHLNGAVSNFAISHFLRLIFGEALDGKEFLHYDRQNCQIVVASMPRDPDCPVCGLKGYLGAGDESPELRLSDKGGRIGRFRLRDGKIIEKPDRQPDDSDSKPSGGDPNNR
jgi:molybdopterin/thiamine biosynthesis adenylyltransferase